MAKEQKGRRMAPVEPSARKGRILALVLVATLLLGIGIVWLQGGFPKNGQGADTSSVQTEEEPAEQPLEAAESREATEEPEDRVESAEESAEGLPEETAGEDSEPTEISLIMVGDMLMHMRVQNSGRQSDGTYQYDAVFAHTTDLISAADLAIVNQEVILGGTELGLSGYPLFNAAYELGDALVNAGFNLICHATNHALDKGETGILNCLNVWRTNYPAISVLGIHDSQEDRDTLCLIEQDGIIIAVLNYTYGTNGISLPHSYSVDLLEEEQVCADLAQAREVADFIIVIPHWGTEYSNTVSSDQRYWAQLFLENGVDLVIGTHAHVVQGVEWLEDESGHRMLVYYSLGNFVNSTMDTGSGIGQRILGVMATVTLQVENGAVSVSDYGIVPLITHLPSGTNGITVYPFREYTEELLKQNLMSSQDPSFSMEYCVGIFQSVFGDLYQP